MKKADGHIEARRLFGLSLRTVWYSFLIGAYSCALFVVLGEVALRVSGYKMRALPWAWTAEDGGMTSLDGRRIWSLRANYENSYWKLKTDGDGFRVSADEPPPARMDCPKIFFVGDSNVFGHGVE